MSAVNIAVIGPGLVGTAFVDLLLGHISNSRQPDLNLVAIANSKKMIFHNFHAWTQEQGEPYDITLFTRKCSESMPCIVVDCTSNQGIADMYLQWMQLGLSIVTPNKKAFSGSLEYYKKLKSLDQRKAGLSPVILHESTVGAGLPLLSTINDLLDSGDEITRIEGILSGTLSYIFNSFSSLNENKTKFSDVVMQAKEKGYTEPDPRDDLNGLDVARKVVILARLIGMDISLDQVPVDNIVPESLRNASFQEFMAKLSDYDKEFERMQGEAREQDQVLRYVGVISHGQCSVNVKKYAKSHAFAGLTGSDNIVRIESRLFPNGLVIQGAGAGAEVTAFGIFSDVLRIARSEVRKLAHRPGCFAVLGK